MIEIEITPTPTKAASRRHYFSKSYIKIFLYIAGENRSLNTI